MRAWHPAVPSLREAYHAWLDHAYPMHTHDDWTVMLLDDGAVAYDVDHADHLATTAVLTLLPPGIPHDGRPAVEGHSYRKRVLYLDAEWLPERAQGFAARQPTLTAPGLLAAAQQVHAALREPSDPMAAEHWLLVVHDHVLTHLGSPAERPRDAPLARRLRDLLDDRYTESFTITEAADQFGAHPSHLARVFSQTYGIAPHQYVIGRRVDRARRLLLGGLRPSEAAALAGFHDRAHLTRHFRRVLGTTPGAFAAQA